MISKPRNSVSMLSTCSFTCFLQCSSVTLQGTEMSWNVEEGFYTCWLNRMDDPVFENNFTSTSHSPCPPRSCSMTLGLRQPHRGHLKILCVWNPWWQMIYPSSTYGFFMLFHALSSLNYLLKEFPLLFRVSTSHWVKAACSVHQTCRLNGMPHLEGWLSQETRLLMKPKQKIPTCESSGIYVNPSRLLLSPSTLYAKANK